MIDCQCGELIIIGQVYGFGWNETFSQVGVEGEKMINEPHEMYAGKGKARK